MAFLLEHRRFYLERGCFGFFPHCTSVFLPTRPLKDGSLFNVKILLYFFNLKYFIYTKRVFTDENCALTKLITLYRNFLRTSTRIILGLVKTKVGTESDFCRNIYQFNFINKISFHITYKTIKNTLTPFLTTFSHDSTFCSDECEFRL